MTKSVRFICMTCFLPVSFFSIFGNSYYNVLALHRSLPFWLYFQIMCQLIRSCYRIVHGRQWFRSRVGSGAWTYLGLVCLGKLLLGKISPLYFYDLPSIDFGVFWSCCQVATSRCRSQLDNGCGQSRNFSCVVFCPHCPIHLSLCTYTRSIYEKIRQKRTSSCTIISPQKNLSFFGFI